MSSPEELRCSLEEKGGVTWYPDGASGKRVNEVGSLQCIVNFRTSPTVKNVHASEIIYYSVTGYN